MKRKLLIIGSSQGVYGGIEAFMMTIADAAKLWPEFEVKLCYKLVKGTVADENLINMAKSTCQSVHFVSKNSVDLYRLIIWADIIHAQNMPPDIVFSSIIMHKKLFLTVHNRKHTNFSLHNLIWSISIKFADKRWFNSNFVWNSWEPNKKSKNSYCIPTVCKLPTKNCEIDQRKGFIFVGRWIENKGIEEILIAYKNCNLDHNLWPLTILGNGPIKTKIMTMIEQLDLHHIILPGFVNDQTKEEMIAHSKWLLAPAKTKEDLGLTPIEARNVGVPSIVTNDGGLPESAGHGALVAEVNNIESLINCMMLAVNMSDSEYEYRSNIGKESLSVFLKPIEFYRNEFLN